MSHLRGTSHGRLGRRKLLIGFGIAFPLLLAITALIGAAATPVTHARCVPYRPCGPPSSSPVVDLQVWRSTTYGFALAYPASRFTIIKQDGASVVLELKDGKGLLIVGGRPAAGGSTSAAVRGAFSALSGTINGLTPDTRPLSKILGANVGFRSASWGAFVGTFAGTIAPNQPTTVAIQSASDGKVIITTAALDFSRSGSMSEAYYLADQVFDTVQWAS